MNLYLPGAKIIKGSDCGPMLGGPRKVVWHTTENDPKTTTAANVATYLQRSGNTVHLVWNPLTGETVAMIPANLGGKGLENRAGGVQTNRGGTYVIQIEVVGRASVPFTSGPCVGLPEIQAWLTSLGIPAVWSGTPDRSTANWAKSGHFGHADVPENSHWDPGKVDKVKLTSAPPTFTTTDTEDELMALTLTNPATKADATAASGLSSIWAYTFLNYKMLVELGKAAGIDVDEAAIAAQVAASLAGPLKAAVVAAATTGGSPEAIADAVVARLATALTGA